MLHEYRDADDRVLCYVRRVEAKNDKAKQFYPLTFGVLDGKTGWHTKAPDKPKPLYGLNRLAQAPDATVLLCEGEKSADAAQRLFPHYVAMSWMGGVNGDGGADLALLDGRNVILWPDADEVGGKAVARLMKRLPDAHWVDTAGLPDGYDAADLESDGCADPDAWLIERERTSVCETKPEQEQGAKREGEGQEEQPSGAKPDGEEFEANPAELYGPPTEADYIAALTIADLAAMDEIAFGRIVKPKAALLGVTPTALTKARSAAKAAAAKAARDAEKAARNAANATEKAARDGEKAAKANAVAEAKAAKAEAKAREKEAKEKEREARAREARARLDAQKTPQPLTDDDDDPLREWIPPDPATLPEIIVAGGERPAIADAGLAAMKAAGVPFYQRGKDFVRVCLHQD